MSLRTRLLAATTAAAATASALVVGLPATATAASPGAEQVVQDMGSCFSSARQGDIVLLLDQSGSLRESDAGGDRVRAATALVDDLSAFADRQSLELSITVVGFSVGYDPGAGWQPLSGATAGDVRASVEQVAAVDDGFDTDYWNALEGARADLRDRAAARGEAPGCQALLVFTDGEYDVEPRTTAAARERHGTEKAYAPGQDITTEDGAAAAEAAGIDQLCNDRQQGPVSSLRADGVFLIAIGLQGPDAPPEAFDRIQAIATGTGLAPGTTCGAATDPQTGAFFDAADTDGLAFAFNALGSPDTTPVDIADDVIPPGGTHTADVVLDATIRTATLLVGSTADGVLMSVTGPDGDVLELVSPAAGGAQTAQTTVGDVPVTTEWLTDRTVRVALEQQDLDGWTGVWRVSWYNPPTAAGDARVRGQLVVTGDLRPTLLEVPDPVRAEAGVPFRLGLVRTTGEPVTADDVQGSALLTADLVLADGTVLPVADGADVADLEAPVELDLSSAAIGQAVLQMRLAVTTAPSGSAPGTQLAPQTASTRVVVVPPASYPTVSDAPVTFPTTEGLAPATAVLQVTGPGCAWVSGVEVTSRPEGVETLDVAAPDGGDGDTCLLLGEGQSGEITLVQTPGQEGNGGTSGVITVSLTGTDADAPALTVDVPFSGELRREPDDVRRIVVLVLALLLGLGVPPLFLVGLRRATSRIPGDSGGLWAVVTDVRVVDGRVTDIAGGPPRLGADQRRNLSVPPKGTRRAAVPGTPLELRVRDGLNPFAVPTVRARALDGRPVVSGTAPHQDGRGAGVLPLAVHNRWVALRSVGPDVVTVVLLVAGAASTDDLHRLSDDVLRQLPDLAGRLPRPEPTGPPVAAVSSWDGGPLSPPPPGQQPGYRPGGSSLDDW